MPNTRCFLGATIRAPASILQTRSAYGRIRNTRTAPTMGNGPPPGRAFSPIGPNKSLPRHGRPETSSKGSGRQSSILAMVGAFGKATGAGRTPRHARTVVNLRYDLVHRRAVVGHGASRHGHRLRPGGRIL